MNCCKVGGFAVFWELNNLANDWELFFPLQHP